LKRKRKAPPSVDEDVSSGESLNESSDNESTLDSADCFTREELTNIKVKSGRTPHLILAQALGYGKGSQCKATLIKFLVDKRRITIDEAKEINLVAKGAKGVVKKKRVQVDRFRYKCRKYAPGFVKLLQTDLDNIKHAKWFQEFEDAIINTPDEIQSGEEVVQVPMWSRISRPSLQKSIRRVASRTKEAVHGILSPCLLLFACY